MRGLFFLCTLIFSLKHVATLASAPQDEYNREREIIMSRLSYFIEQTLAQSAPGTPGGIEDDDLASAIAHFEELLLRPLPVNRATRGELEELLVLSGFQIESILNYRENNGNILSAAELSLVHGFDEQIVDVIAPFLTFGDYDDQGALIPKFGSLGEFFRVCDSQLYLKSSRNLHYDPMFSPITKEEFEQKPNSRYLGTPYYMQLRFKSNLGPNIGAGFTLENDIGERFMPEGGPMVDFFSFHIELKNIGKLKKIIIGDYSVRAGQGLTVWNSFSLGGIGEPSALYKKGSIFLPSTSAQEGKSFRGAAASFSFGKLDLNAMASINRLDARIDGDKYTSIVEGGIHNTVSSVECRNSMRESIGGVNLSYMFKRLKVGITAVAYGYDKSNGRGVKDYNRYQMYDGVWGNCSFDYYAVLGNVRLFGEMALDFGGSGALLAGIILPLGPKVESALLLRSYSKSYIAPHASAYSTLSTVSNQMGVVADLKYTPLKWSGIIYYGEYVYYPWVRYNIDHTSYMVKNSLKWEWEREMWSGYLSLAHTYYSHNALHKCYVRSKLSFKLSEKTRAAIHGAFVSTVGSGYEIGTDWKMKFFDGILALSPGIVLFNCKDWNNRLYIYEKDMPYTYGSRLLYGRGLSMYLLMEGNIGRYIGVYIKNGTRCYFNDKGPQSELKLAMKIRF